MLGTCYISLCNPQSIFLQGRATAYFKLAHERVQMRWDSGLSVWLRQTEPFERRKRVVGAEDAGVQD
jgi:hypothetical protein